MPGARRGTVKGLKWIVRGRSEGHLQLHIGRVREKQRRNISVASRRGVHKGRVAKLVAGVDVGSAAEKLGGRICKAEVRRCSAANMDYGQSSGLPKWARQQDSASALDPSLLRAFTCAPRSSSSRTMCTRLHDDANMSGVHPRRSGRSRRAPASSSVCAS